MSKQTIGPREQQLRDMRAAKAGDGLKVTKAVIDRVAASLPKTSGKKPVKRKVKR